MTMMIELELKAVGHLQRMRQAGSGLVGPCPKCSADGAFVVCPVGDGEAWECASCDSRGQGLVSFKGWLGNNLVPATEPATDKPKANGRAEQKETAKRKIAKPKKAAKPKTDDADNVIYLKDQIEKLAKMPRGIERSMERGRIAGSLGVTRRDIDDEVERLNEERELEALYEHWKTKPWPNSVDTDALVRDLAWRIHKHVVCSYEIALTASLWVMFAWTHDAATHSLMLLVTSLAAAAGALCRATSTIDSMTISVRY